MKKIVFGSLVTVVVVVSSLSVVRGERDPVTPPTAVRTTPGMLTNMIDGIDVPWEILEYIQMKYEGYAVTKADKIKRGNSELYRLRVDRDDQPGDYDSLAVLFDMQWKLVGEEKYASPPPKPAAAPAPKPQDKQEEKPQSNDKPAEEKPQQTKPPEDNSGTGGSGGGTPTEQPSDPTVTDTQPTTTTN